MRASTKNRIMGTFHEVKGSCKAAIGSTLNSRRVALSGRVERVGGIMQAKFGLVEKIFGW